MGEITFSRISSDKNWADFGKIIRKKLDQVNILTPLVSNAELSNQDKKNIVRHKVKKITDLQSSNRISFFVHPPKTRVRKSMLKIGLIILLAFLPRILNFTYLIGAYTTISERLIRMFTLTAASQSVQTLFAIYWREYKTQYFTGSSSLSEVDRWILDNSESVFYQIGGVNDDFIRKKMDNEKLCKYTIPFISGNGSKVPYSTLCEYMTRLRPNITVMETYHLIKNNQMVLKDMISKKDRWVDFKQFIESQDKAFADAISYFLMVALRAMSSEYSAEVDQYMKINEQVSITILSISSVVLVFLIFGYYRWWIPHRLRKWHIVKNCFLIMNCRLINNEYIKSYFKCSADRQFDLDLFDKAVLDY